MCALANLAALGLWAYVSEPAARSTFASPTAVGTVRARPGATPTPSTVAIALRPPRGVGELLERSISGPPATQPTPQLPLTQHHPSPHPGTSNHHPIAPDHAQKSSSGGAGIPPPSPHPTARQRPTISGGTRGAALTSRQPPPLRRWDAVSIPDKEEARPQALSRMHCLRYRDLVKPRDTRKPFGKHFFKFLLDGHNCVLTNACVRFGSRAPHFSRTDRPRKDAIAPIVEIMSHDRPTAKSDGPGAEDSRESLEWDPAWLWHMHEKMAESSVSYRVRNVSTPCRSNPNARRVGPDANVGRGGLEGDCIDGLYRTEGGSTWHDVGVLGTRIDLMWNYGHMVLQVLMPLYEAFWERGMEDAFLAAKQDRPVWIPLDGGAAIASSPHRRCLRRELCGRYCKCDATPSAPDMISALFSKVRWAQWATACARVGLDMGASAGAPSTRHQGTCYKTRHGRCSKGFEASTHICACRDCLPP